MRSLDMRYVVVMQFAGVWYTIRGPWDHVPISDHMAQALLKAGAKEVKR